ncbi:MAG: hypothetical protein IJL10_03475, partial [Synergistaceae bacterium]|nr:hypothetical protein [Synergistaceae bacterium]
GLHWGMIAGKIKAKWPEFLAIIAAGYGLYAFVWVNDIFSYIFLTNDFAFLDYDKNPVIVILENISMMSFWTLAGYQASKILTGKFRTPLIVTGLSILAAFAFRFLLGVPDAGF